MLRIAIIIGLSISTFFFGFNYFATRSIDSELAGSRERVEQLTEQYRQIASQNESLRIRFDSIQGGIREANRLIDEISSENRDIKTTVRITIENLKKIKAIITGIADL